MNKKVVMAALALSGLIFYALTGDDSLVKLFQSPEVESLVDAVVESN